MMLIVKVIALQGDRLVSSPTVPLFGFIWFMLSDWIPRCIPSFAFVYLMNIKRGKRDRGGAGGGTTEGLLKGDFLSQSSGHFGTSDDYGDDEDDLSSLNDYQEGEYFDDEEEDYLTESRYSDDFLRPTYSNKPYAWSEGSEDNIYVGDAGEEEEEHVVHYLNPGPETAPKKSPSSSKRPFFSRNHYSWTALSSGFSFTNLTSANTSATKPSHQHTSHESSGPSSSTSQMMGPESDDISMTGFTSLTQLTSNRRGGGTVRETSSGRVSPQQKNDGYNNTAPGKGVPKRSVEL
jgi:hypothetical protein